MTKSKPPRRRNPSAQPDDRQAPAEKPGSAVESEGGAGLAAALETQWASSRAGAVSGRGYRYQDLVGAWLGLRLLAGEVAGSALVVEGLDDLTCEGPPDTQVQVKSRQERVGDFGVSEVARHIVDAWERRGRRLAPTAAEQVVLVLERAVGGYGPDDWQGSIAADPAWAGLVEAVQRRATGCGFQPAEVGSLLAQTTVVVLPQRMLLKDAAALVVQCTGLPLGAALPVVQAVRAAVGDRADQNTQREWSGRASLSRGHLQRLVVAAAALVDRASLMEALRAGVCEPVDFDLPLDNPEFYLGVSTQPGHVAAGLVVPRPDLVDEVIAGLGAGRPVLVAGPSGVGKSAVLWMAGYVARHVIWYRVHRLRDDDVEPLLRLAVAAGAGRYGPVGFLVDGVGTETLTAWDQLHRRMSGTPGVLLVGSVREEDTLPLATLGDSVVVRPRLDEDLAARLHVGLQQRGAAVAAHWREAYEQSAGLTLEFAHLLTRGRRLRDVVAAQVRTRVRERRFAELGALAPVVAAHQWGASLEVDALTRLMGGEAGELQAALARLVEEHLLTLDGSRVTGLHQLRSAALCEAVHEVPPPTLASTVSQVVRHLDADQLETFIFRSVSDKPGLYSAVLGGLRSRWTDPAACTVLELAAGLAGLRLADFTRVARRWAEVLEGHQVPVPLRPLAFQFALARVELDDKLFDPAVVAAVREIRRDADQDERSPLRDLLVDMVGRQTLSRLISSTDRVEDATALLAPLAGGGLDLELGDGRLAAAAVETPVEQLAELISTAAAVSPGVGQAVLALAGGRDQILQRLRSSHPWLLDLQVRTVDGEVVLWGRVLQVADRLTPDPEAAIKEFAALGLRCLPDVDRADLSTVLAGGATYAFDGHAFAVSKLARRYAVPTNSISWNRIRVGYASTLVAAASTTEHLSEGLALTEKVADYLADLAEAWITNKGVGKRLTLLNNQRTALRRRIEGFAPAPTPLNALGQPDPALSDPVHGLAHGVVLNLAGRLQNQSEWRALAAYVGDTLAGLASRAAAEPWTLLGGGTPPALHRLSRTLQHLTAVLAELAYGNTPAPSLANAARHAAPGQKLEAAATAAGQAAQDRYQQLVEAVAADASARGLSIDVKSRPDPAADTYIWPPVQTAVAMHLDAITDYDTALAELSVLLQQQSPPAPSVAVIPLIEGKPLPGSTVQLFPSSGNRYPLPDAADPWLPDLPEPLATPCSAAAVEVVSALRELSSLAYLMHHREWHPQAQAVAEEATATYRSSHNDLIQLAPQDDVVQLLAATLDELAEHVDQELAGTHTDHLAADLTSGGDSELKAQINRLLAIATAWDIDPSTAAALLV